MMSIIFKNRRRGQQMYGVGVFCSRCQKWFLEEECDKGKGGVLLCPDCHSIVRRNRRG